MAQNDYGINILGVVSIVFAFTYVVQLFKEVSTKDGIRIWEVADLVGLIIMASILAMRVYFWRFEYVELVFGIAGTIHIVVYVRKAIMSLTGLRKKNSTFSIVVLVFQVSIVFYLLSMVTVPFVPKFAEPAGGFAFALLLVFVAVNFVKRDFMLDGEKISPFRYIVNQRDRSIVLMSLFFTFTLYMGLTKVELLPKMYSDQFPQAYFELVDRAESGEEKPVDGDYKHEEFKRKYEQFIQRHKQDEKK
jgi:hypothetical protein